MDLTVVVGTYGEREWAELACARAVPSALAQGLRVHHVHGATLHEARNEGIAAASTEWVVVLDADDELVEGYGDAMMAGTADVRAPAVQYVRNGRIGMPYVPNVAGHTHMCSGECLPYGNWIVIGACARREQILDVGGFRDFTWSEDWDLWARLWLAGATFESIPQAVYRAHARPDSRNRAPSRQVRLEAHRAIARANGLPVP